MKKICIMSNNKIFKIIIYKMNDKIIKLNIQNNYFLI